MSADRARKYAEWLVANKDRQGTPEFEKVAAAYKSVRGGVSATSEADRAESRARAAQQADAVENDPTRGMSGPALFAAGMGKKFMDRARGIGQVAAEGIERLNPMDPNSSGMDEAAQASIDRAAQLDKPLMNTGAGMGGYMAGAVAESIPAAFIPGANTVLGSGLIGTGYGLTEPVQTGGSRAGNTAVSALTGAGGQAVANLLPAVGRGFVAPFTRRGQQDIAADVLRQFATDPSAIAGNLPTSAIPGVRYTLAEATKDPGLSTLQRAMMNRPEMSLSMAPQELANIGASREAIERIAGTPGEMGFWSAARESATDPLYAVSNAAQVGPDAQFHALLRRPSMTGAVNRARGLAAERGAPFQIAQGAPAPAPLQSSGGSLHAVKMAMDDMLTPQPGAPGIVGNEAAAVRDTRNDFVNWMNTNVPGYSTARQTFATYSRPINQMQIARELADKLTPALNDASEIPNVTPSAFARALREADDTARAATDFGGARMADIMTDEQMRDINAVAEYFARREFGRNAGRPPGTNTAQNLASGQLMRRILGPMGLPESWTESAAMPAVMRLPQWALRTQEPGIQSQLARAMLDPRYAALIMQQSTNPTRARLLAALLRDRIAPVAGQAAGAVINE